MKTKLMLLSLMLISTLCFSQTVIRVKSGEKIQDIVDSDKNPTGMILLLDPGNYDGFTVNKRVSIIGSGYFNGSNSTTIGFVTLSGNTLGSSEGSFITGCSLSYVEINRNNITIQKCRVDRNGSNPTIVVGPINNCRILQCYVNGTIQFNRIATNFVVQSTIIIGNLSAETGPLILSGKIIYNTIIQGGCSPISWRNEDCNVTVSNNIFTSNTTCNNANGGQNFLTNFFAKFNNNILRKGNYQSSDVSNKFLTDMTTIFANTGSSDAQYTLSATSPAKGAGEGGTDCGAFGGTEPYIIGGLPIGPVITDLQVPSIARQNETIQIKLKAKVQN